MHYSSLCGREREKHVEVRKLESCKSLLATKVPVHQEKKKVVLSNLDRQGVHVKAICDHVCLSHTFSPDCSRGGNSKLLARNKSKC